MVAAIAEYHGPVYARISRAGSPDVFDESHKFEIGKGTTLHNGSDVTIVACGSLLYRCVQAAKALADAGINARVISTPTIKPLDVELVQQAAGETGAVVTAEEHSIVGGLGGEDIPPELIEKAIMYAMENDPPQQEAIWLGLEEEAIDDYDRSTLKIF